MENNILILEADNVAQLTRLNRNRPATTGFNM